MHPVLRTDLAWKEETWDDSSHFVGKRVVECVVHQDEETCSETIWVVMTLANQNGDHEVVKLLASSCPELPDHYIIHAFLSDPKSGYVVNEFPLDRTILGVTRVSREEAGRSWSCTGYSMNDGCHISGLKFVLQGKPSESNSELHVILHCWEQCKPMPCCGDPHSPSYHLFRIARFGDPSGTKRSAFLPPDFLAHIGDGDGFCPLDPSGMLLGGTPRAKSLRYNLSSFACVRKQLGVGKWTAGPFWQFRAAHLGERLIQLVLPSKANTFGLGCIGGQVKWQEIVDKAWEQDPTQCTILQGSYESMKDIWHLPPSRITSKELNAMLNLEKESTSLVIPASKWHQVLSNFMVVLSGPNAQRQAISVRFTKGTALRGLGFELGLGAASLGPFKSRVQHGCEGGSLGYHLVESNQMRNVITLHGSVEDLMFDLEQACAGSELEFCKGLIREGRTATLLGMRCGRGYAGGLDQEVMSMRISNPSAQALMACAMTMDGKVQYDTKTKAIYPITWEMGGNLRREAACALILEILKAMKTCMSTTDSISSVIRMQEIH